VEETSLLLQAEAAREADREEVEEVEGSRSIRMEMQMLSLRELSNR